jgi:integrase
MLRNHIKGTRLGAMPVVKVKPSHIQSWCKERGKAAGGSLAPISMPGHIHLLRAMFEAAVMDEIIARNPVPTPGKLSLPAVEKEKVVPLTVRQVRDWAAKARKDVRAMILVQAGLGCRIGELLALRVEDVDFLRREVHFVSQVYLGKRVFYLKAPGSKGTVPLPPRTAAVLAEHIRRFPPAADGSIFTNQAGNLWHHAKQWEKYHDSAAAAEMPEGTSSHDLRHHYASVLLAAGHSIQEVADRLRDKPEMILKVYGHLMPDKQDARDKATRRAIEDAWAAAEAAISGHQQSADGTTGHGPEAGS